MYRLYGYGDFTDKGNEMHCNKGTDMKQIKELIQTISKNCPKGCTIISPVDNSPFKLNRDASESYPRVYVMYIHTPEGQITIELKEPTK